MTQPSNKDLFEFIFSNVGKSFCKLLINYKIYYYVKISESPSDFIDLGTVLKLRNLPTLVGSLSVVHRATQPYQS